MKENDTLFFKMMLQRYMLGHWPDPIPGDGITVEFIDAIKSEAQRHQQCEIRHVSDLIVGEPI